MKHTITAIFLILFLSACGQNQATDDPTPIPAPATATLMPEPENTATLPAPIVEATATTAEMPAATNTPAPLPSPTAPTTATGVLISVTMTGTVGVRLNEIPLDMRDRVVEAIMAQPESMWIDRAIRQTRLTRNRLNFRNYIYDDKGALPLPPEELWHFELTSTPERQIVGEHTLVLVNYTFTSTLLAPADAPEKAEPALVEIGGTWAEPFILPLDPDLLLQRTGNACLNEGGFPPNSYDSENTYLFYDHGCTVASGGPLGCHRRLLPQFDCVEAVNLAIGSMSTHIQFERLEWDTELADSVRVGDVISEDTPDLFVVGDDLVDNRIIYRYIQPDDCALNEGSVGGTGWRRLLQFSATVHNLGGEAMHIGPVRAEDLLNVFKYDSCHDHFHYSNYGNFSFTGLGTGELTGDGVVANAGKQAFCVESTSRYSNNEFAPLTHPYSCTFQGIQAGWVDEYRAGLDSQWVDITDIDIPEAGLTAELGFSTNPDEFLCEGELLLDENGDIIWIESGDFTADGDPIGKPACNVVDNEQANNIDSIEVTILPTGGFVTEPCQNGEIGPLRNCGFTQQTEILSCTPGQTVELTASIPATAPFQVIRICEASAVLDTGTACTLRNSLTTRTIATGSAAISFTCPAFRSEDEPGGRYAIYTAPVFPDDDFATVTVE